MTYFSEGGWAALVGADPESEEIVAQWLSSEGLPGDFLTDSDKVVIAGLIRLGELNSARNAYDRAYNRQSEGVVVDRWLAEEGLDGSFLTALDRTVIAAHIRLGDPRAARRAYDTAAGRAGAAPGTLLVDPATIPHDILVFILGPRPAEGVGAAAWDAKAEEMRAKLAFVLTKNVQPGATLTSEQVSLLQRFEYAIWALRNPAAYRAQVRLQAALQQRAPLSLLPEYTLQRRAQETAAAQAEAERAEAAAQQAELEAAEAEAQGDPGAAAKREEAERLRREADETAARVEPTPTVVRTEPVPLVPPPPRLTKTLAAGLGLAGLGLIVLGMRKRA